MYLWYELIEVCNDNPNITKCTEEPQNTGIWNINHDNYSFQAEKFHNSYLHTLLDTQLQKIMGGSGRVIQGKVPSCGEFKQQENVIK